MINASNLTSKNKPSWLLAELPGPARMPQPRAPSGAFRADTWTFRARFRRALARTVRVVAIVGQAPLGWLAAIPRRVGDRLFALNDAEACWHGWQVTRTYGGLGRRYRDAQFGALWRSP